MAEEDPLTGHIRWQHKHTLDGAEDAVDAPSTAAITEGGVKVVNQVKVPIREPSHGVVRTSGRP